jgi:KDO2-lipid IV(A) lauroyltransferase
MAGRRQTALGRLADVAIGWAAGGILSLAMLLPYPARIRTAGWVTSRIVAPVAGYRRRIRENLALVWPDLPETEVRRLCRDVPDNVGRTIAEIWSGREFIERVRDLPLEGPGAAALEAVFAAGQAAILAGGHIGNYDAVRGGLIARGYPFGGLYKPMRNRLFNDRYVRAIETIGRPLFPRGKPGLGAMIRHIRDGGMIGILTDQAILSADTFPFFGTPAHTATSAADLALRYRAPLFTFYGLRQPDGLSFRLWIGGPVPPTDAATMTRALNDELEALVRQQPEQWFWIHRRWKTPGR